MTKKLGAGLAAVFLVVSLAPARAQAPASPDAAPILQLEPLVITAPRLKPVKPGIDPQINMILLQLLQKKANSRPDSIAQSNASVGNLALISTLDGYNLKVRYTQLGFLLTEGLAGTKEFDLQSALSGVAQTGTNNQIRAAAMVALAYTKSPQFLGLFQSALQSTDLTVRFGAIEALLIEGGSTTPFLISNAARTDASLLLQVYAAANMWKGGDNSGEPILQNMAQNNDWLVRAMAVHYLGTLGSAQEYRDLLLQLSQESNPMVQAELCLALVRLSKYQYQ